MIQGTTELNLDSQSLKIRIQFDIISRHSHDTLDTQNSLFVRSLFGILIVDTMNSAIEDAGFTSVPLVK